MKFATIYLAGNAPTASLEVEAVASAKGRLKVKPAPPKVLVTIHGELRHTVDLLGGEIQRALGTDRHELTRGWVRRQAAGLLSPMQLLGREAHASGRITALAVPSARDPRGHNVVVFPDQLTLNPGSYLEVHDPTGKLAQRLP